MLTTQIWPAFFPKPHTCASPLKKKAWLYMPEYLFLIYSGVGVKKSGSRSAQSELSAALTASTAVNNIVSYKQITSMSLVFSWTCCSFLYQEIAPIYIYMYISSTMLIYMPNRVTLLHRPTDWRISTYLHWFCNSPAWNYVDFIVQQFQQFFMYHHNTVWTEWWQIRNIIKE